VFSSQGLQDWELLVVSGMCALCILAISSAIGWTVAAVVLHEPVAKEASVKVVDGILVAASPAIDVPIAEPAIAGQRSRVAMG